jgi:hypothetical protein
VGGEGAAAGEDVGRAEHHVQAGEVVEHQRAIEAEGVRIHFDALKHVQSGEARRGGAQVRGDRLDVRALVAPLLPGGHVCSCGADLGRMFDHHDPPQAAFGRRIAQAMGFDFDAGRLDTSAPAAHRSCLTTPKLE